MYHQQTKVSSVRSEVGVIVQVMGANVTQIEVRAIRGCRCSAAVAHSKAVSGVIVWAGASYCDGLFVLVAWDVMKV